MRSFFCALVAVGAALTVYASDSNNAPQTTSSLGYAGNRRAGATATVTLGPSSAYVASLASNAPKPSGTSFTIVPAGDSADDGLNLIIGPDLQKQLGSALKDKCSDPKSDPCHQAILNLLPIEQVAIQRRQVGLLVDIGIAIRYIYVAITVALAADAAGKALSAYHAPASNLEQAQSPTSASAYGFVSTANASPTILTVQPSDTPDPTPAVSAGDGKGFTINVPQNEAQRIGDFIGMNSGGCPKPVTKRSLTASRLNKRDPPDADTIACLVLVTVTLIRNMVNGPLADWVRLNRNNRNIAPAGAGAAVVLANVNDQVAPLQQQVGLPQDQWRLVQQAAYWEAYYRVVLRKQPGTVQKFSEDDVDLAYCPPKKLVHCGDDDCNGSNGKCSTSSPLKTCECNDEDGDDDAGGCFPKVAPACINCGGDAGGNKCKGVGDQQALKGCSCFPLETPLTRFKSEDDLKATQKALLGLKDIPDESSIPDHCELRKRDEPFELVVMDRAFYENLAKKACKDYPGDPSKSFDVKLTNKDADSQYANKYPGYTIEFKWDDKPGVCDPLTCQQIFTSFDHNIVCSPSPDNLATTGTRTLDCGVATYTITKDTATSPSSTPLAQCPAPYPKPGSNQAEMSAWWDANHCDKKCPGGQATCDPNFNAVARICTCNDEACQNADPAQAFCADQSKSNPWNELGRRRV